MDNSKRPATEAEAKALASALRLRILRLCLDEALTNKDIAARLGSQPATTLHHVRTLVATGFLAPAEVRRGARGSREIPYRATGKSWHMSITDTSAVAAGNQAMINAFLQEVELVDDPGQIMLTRMGLRLSDENAAAFMERLHEIFEEYKQRPPDPDGKPVSMFFALHPDTGRLANEPSMP
ncbi:helix-turn-helix domain-containing protein [Catelliglobosispora koreensis]|uniref:helix-turn-helix domain-containing protein n=1 Tax=Catelliglobosispora koreensis TaxID=129052 RepID=UPI00037AC7AE|nr:helix-turn-helix domain-containing protein [Catelliglobosispora koreensis]